MALSSLLRAGALLSTTLTIASAARGLRAAAGSSPASALRAHGGLIAHARAPCARALSRVAALAGAPPPPSPATAAPAASGPARKFREVDLRGFLIPLVDDVVRYPSKWPGEYLLGAVDYVQALPEDRGYVVDVRPLKATGNDRWESKRGSKLVQAVDAGKLRVVKEASYDERADVWTVPEQVTMSLFAPIKRPPPDPERVEGGMLEYNELKWRLVREVTT
ncbi:hypothetical protein T492DRAFT_871705 [Pavlovales sp. CCMP2436]|nr:hypothetical protein T492DRAFT_871705 [Pavlovales sp. CCMP2436]